MAVTIQDVAREAGVSRTTVSFVLNRRTGTRIREETAERVRKGEKLAYLQRLSNAAVDGWILADVVEEEIIAWLRDASVPTVVVGGGTVTSDLDCIYPDDTEAARQVTGHLFSLGHRRFAFVSPHSYSDSVKARLLGYRQALEKRGVPPEAGVVYSVGWESEALTAWLQGTVLSGRTPTAVIALDDRQALVLMKAAQAHGLEVPRDLSVVGFDDIPMAALWEPPLTTVRMPMRHMGAFAFRRLLERMAHPGLPVMKMMLPVELMVRGSTAPPAR